MKPDTVRRTLALLAALLAAAALVIGAMMAGDPGSARMRRFDQERSGALQTLSSMARSAYAEDGALPASLDALVGSSPVAKMLSADPRSGQPYGYRTISKTSFELCATFELPSETPVRHAPIGKPGAIPMTDYWTHPAGTTCWTERLES